MTVQTESNDLVYREYNSGFDIDCADGAVTVQWNLPAEVVVDKIYLDRSKDRTNRELTEEEIADRSVTITESGHYLLYGIDESGKVVDFTEYLSFSNETTYVGDGTSVMPP